MVQVIQAAESLSISNEAVIGLLKGATDVLTKMPLDLITAGVRTLCSLQIQHLSLLLGEQDAIKPGQPHIDPCVWVDRLTAVFRSCVVKIDPGQTHPCTPILEEVWPIISTLCYKFKDDQRVVERICRWVLLLVQWNSLLFFEVDNFHFRCLRFMLRSTSMSASVIVSQLVTMVSSGQSCDQSWCHLPPTVCRYLSSTSPLMLSLSRLNSCGWIWICPCLSAGTDWNVTGIRRGISSSVGRSHWPCWTPRHCRRPIQTISKVSLFMQFFGLPSTPMSMLLAVFLYVIM